MTFRVEESFCLGKYGDARCEDLIHQSESFVAIIDGATSTNAVVGKSPGRLMAELIDEALHTANGDFDVQSALRHINAYVRKKLGYRDSSHVQTSGPRPAAAAIVFSRSRQEVWSVGDGWVLIDGKREKLEIEFAQPYTYLRCAYVDALRRQGAATDELLESTKDWDLIRPFIEIQTGIQNNPDAKRFAYGVVDGSDQCIPFSRVFDSSSAKEIVLASDGYPEIRPTLEASERLLADAIRRDPLMIDLYPQCKPVRPGQISFDDRSFVRMVRN